MTLLSVCTACFLARFWGLKLAYSFPATWSLRLGPSRMSIRIKTHGTGAARKRNIESKSKQINPLEGGGIAVVLQWI